MLTLYNTANRQKQAFKPQDPNRITMYVCGPTVYNHAHIGNARPVVVFDTLYRLLQHHYGQEHVVYARNITDVDDKILQASLETGQTPRQLTEKYTRIFHDDIAALNALPPTIEPRATESIDGMIALIEQLLAKNMAYQQDGHVLFDTEAFKGYGKLSGRMDNSARQAGARVTIESYKRNPADFVLWKPADRQELGWESAYGYGRPGWHLECSAMVKKHLGEQIDIHGGGQDLIFPHHENEQAQSCAAHGHTYVNYWLHNGFVTVDGHKMSKSLGNFLTISQAREQAHGEAIRYLLLSAHYKQPVDYAPAALQNARNNLDKIYQYIADDNTVSPTMDETYVTHLNDDLNTPLALQRLQELVKLQADKALIRKSAQLLGLLYDNTENWFRYGVNLSEKDIEQKIEQRQQAKNKKDYATADSIRKELEEQGIILEDGADTTTWRRQ